MKGVQNRLQRLLNDQQKAELDCAASNVHSSEDEMSVQEQEELTAQPSDSAHSTRLAEGAPLYISSSDESSYAERDCSSDEESDDESESQSNTDLGSSDESSCDGDRSYSSTADGGSSSGSGENYFNAQSSGARSNHVLRADTRDKQRDHSSSDTSSTSRASDLAESTLVFLTRLRSTGMDFIAPRSIHYQVYD